MSKFRIVHERAKYFVEERYWLFFWDRWLRVYDTYDEAAYAIDEELSLRVVKETFYIH